MGYASGFCQAQYRAIIGQLAQVVADDPMENKILACCAHAFIDRALYNEASVDGSDKERTMNKLGLAVAVVMLLSVLAAGIAAAVSVPGGMEVSANASGSPATEVAAAGQQRLTITDVSRL